VLTYCGNGRQGSVGENEETMIVMNAKEPRAEETLQEVGTDHLVGDLGFGLLLSHRGREGGSDADSLASSLRAIMRSIKVGSACWE